VGGRGREVTTAARALLSGLVDYAGLFPPAALGLADAAAQYARHRREPEVWMLGRFVVPAARLDDLGHADALPGAGADEPWRLSALLGADVAGDSAAVAAFNEDGAGRAFVDSVELRASTPAEIRAALAFVPSGCAAFVEVPLGSEVGTLLRALRDEGARAKVRTGGVVPEAIPDAAALARFIEACAATGVPFKATAGLHHAVRAEHPLSSAPGASRTTTHGFLNVFAAAAFARGGMGSADIERVLREERPGAFTLDAEDLRWRERSVSAADLAATREGLACGFGSCSFAEPVADLKAMGVIA
jgi:hypothetical protein